MAHPPHDSVLDALIVGAGFSGLDALHRFRSIGLSVHLYEAGSRSGGCWFWNQYPGARTDSDHQIYHMQNLELQKHNSDFEWSERFAGREEMLKYFTFVEQKLCLTKDITFNSRVIEAVFDPKYNEWKVKVENTSEGQVFNILTKNLILCTGFTSKIYVPNFKGLEKFKGPWFHSARWPWPHGGTDFLVGKKVAVVGTGASGVQIIQEIGAIVSELTVYQRTPNLTVPMHQYKSGKDFDYKWKIQSSDIVSLLRESSYGTTLDDLTVSALEVSPEESEKTFEKLFDFGGFAFSDNNYKDVMKNQLANDTCYNFWAKKTRARVTDPVKRDLLAPLTPPHPFGTKRVSLEQNYYEILNQPNVTIINTKASPILEITEDGVRTEKEGEIKVDVLILATGYDAITGAILDIQIISEHGITLQEKWASGIKTQLGIATAGFPNLYFTLGPGSPIAFLNAPTLASVQVEWLQKLMMEFRSNNWNRVEVKIEAETSWTKELTELWDKSLYPLADSWYQGANIPGKRKEALNWIGGLPSYIQRLKQCAENNYDGFDID